MSSPILITVPKIIPANSPVFKDYVDCKIPEPSKGRKRRLDHLSWEEKLQRKKLKNRVAAQTSRDRKKLKMDEMETQIQTLMNQNQLLLQECQKLRSLNQKLTSENQKLQNNSCHCHNSDKNTSTNKLLPTSPIVDSRPTPSRSAASSPQPKGEGLESAVVLKKRREITMLVLKMLLVCLMTKDGTFLKNSTSQNLKNLQKVCWRMSPEIWKKLMDKNRIYQIVSHKITQEKWWGRHQNNWNPVETIA